MAMPSPATQTDREVLAGLVERVTFHNAETGFCVLRIKARGHRDLVTVVGHAATISAGEWITASGEWVNDRTHGQQFKARFMRTSAPTSIEGIEKYLASGMIRGIGPVYAKKMVKAFGEKVFDIIEAEPDRLREVDGIGPVRAQRITAAWAEQKIVREIMVFLHSHGVGTARAVRIFKTYGADAVQVMTENPYRLARDIRGIGFKTADAIAMRLGIEKTAMIRVRAGISYALTEAMDEGHCGLPTEELVPLAVELLEVPKELVADRAGSRTGRGDGDRRHGWRDGLRLPRRPVSGRTGHCRAAAAPGQRNAALAVHRSGEGAAVDRAEDRPVAGRKSGRRDPAGPAVEGPGHHRRTGRGQDDHRQLDPAHPGRQGREPAALRADRPRRQAHDRSHRVRGQDHSPAARGRSEERRLQTRAATTRSNATCWSSTRPPWSMSC